MSKRAIPGGATQASVGAALCAFIGLTAAVAMTAISSATNRKKMAIFHCSRKVLLAVFVTGTGTWSSGALEFTELYLKDHNGSVLPSTALVASNETLAHQRPRPCDL